jgi:hypothetical protein
MQYHDINDRIQRKMSALQWAGLPERAIGAASRWIQGYTHPSCINIAAQVFAPQAHPYLKALIKGFPNRSR